MNLIDIHKAFVTEEQCFYHLQQIRWPKGVRCITCGANKISVISRQTKSKNKRVRIYQCLEPTCKQQFTDTSGTLFHDSHLPLSKWFMALALISDAKKGISAKQLERHLHVNYRTAWHMAHRIRKAMTETGGRLSGIVEMDETYVGGKRKGVGIGTKSHRQIVVGLRQRGGDLRFIHAKDTKSATLYKIMHEHVDEDKVAALFTDDAPAYQFAVGPTLRPKHRTINHSMKIYASGDVHTNTIESAFSLLKRGIIGNFHQVSIKHLHRYLSEFQYRFNRREGHDIFAEALAKMPNTGALPYQQLVAAP